MGDDFMEHGVDIFRVQAVAVHQPGMHARRLQQHAHAARAGAGLDEACDIHVVQPDAEAGRVLGRFPQIQRIFLDGLAGLDAGLQGIGEVVQLVELQDIGLDLLRQLFRMLEPGIEHQRLLQCAVVRDFDRDLHHEAVACRRRNLEGLVLFHLVAVGEHHHVRQAVFPLEGMQVPFRHHAQHERVHLRAGAVDLVEEEHRQVFAGTQQRALVDLRTAIRAEVGMVDQVVRHQVHGALDAFVGATDAARDGLQQRGLADPDAALQQHVAARKNGDVHQPDCLVLADDDLLDLIFQLERMAAPIGQLVLDSCDFHRFLAYAYW